MVGYFWGYFRFVKNFNLYVLMSYLSISIESIAIFLAGKAVCYRILAFFC